MMAETKPTAPISIKTTKLAGANNIHNTNLQGQKNLLSTSLNFNQKKRNNKTTLIVKKKDTSGHQFLFDEINSHAQGIIDASYAVTK
jgi:hypothetical protein